MHFSATQLTQLSPRMKPERATTYAAALSLAIDIAQLSTLLRTAHFMAQMAHESAGFSALVESTNYKDAEFLVKTFSNVKTLDHANELIAQGPQAIANCIYANHIGNGDEASGDGYRYRGRGFIMITGRANYQIVKDYTGIDVIAEPQLLGQADTAAKAAAYFWQSHNINKAADADDIKAVTKIINGAYTGLSDRETWLSKAKKIW